MKLVKDWWDSLELNPKSIALSRILFSLVCLYDLVNLIPVFKDFYTNSGVHPLKSSFELIDFGQWSVQQLLPYDLTITLLFAICMLAFIGILFGKFTKLSIAVAWISFGSLILRNQAILQYSDYVKHIFLLWFFFQPNSKVSPQNKSSKFASLGLIFFVASLYLMPSFLRDFKYWFIDGKAFYYALSYETDWTLFTSFLLNTLELNKPLSQLVYLLEFSAGFLLIFSNRKLRSIVSILLICFYIILNIFLDIRAFSSVIISILVIFISFGPSKELRQSTVGNVFSFSILCIYVSFFIFSIRDLPMPKGLKFFANGLSMARKWEMFVTYPEQTNWYRILGITNDNQHKDLLSKLEEDYFDKIIPNDSSLFISNRYWSNFFHFTSNFHSSKKLQKIVVTPILKYFCRDNHLKEVSIVKIHKKIIFTAKEKAPTKEENLLKLNCKQ
jgi:hypothetical protein